MDECQAYLEESECTCVIEEIEGFVSEEEFALAITSEELSPVADAAFTAALLVCSETSSVVGGPFADEIRMEFMSGCVPDAGEAFCACALTELEGLFTEEEFVQANLAQSDDDLALLVDAAFACEDLLEYETVAGASCTQDWPGLVIPIPDGWVAYEPPEASFAPPCGMFSRVGFDPLTEDDYWLAPLQVEVWTGVGYYEHIAAYLTSPATGAEEIVIGGYQGVRFGFDYEDEEGVAMWVEAIILPVWPEDPTFPLVIQATGKPGTNALRKAIKAVEWIAENIVIPAAGP